ncbi:hypothetical protein [Vibrio hippocampi]|uniref:Uncharacterized protein n=1 Tax=Vibrio hippocampi TaxID=654686 RepID=A0ABM8ZLD1_9VIBR|nr:hypothetical protein [Vibrio hippocampi]CAH0528918.1 hypothetical protein VHP8226_02948 [Vibrio hippocampi]
MNITLTPVGSFILFAVVVIMLLVNAMIAGYAYKAQCAPQSRFSVLMIMVMTMIIPIWGWLACRPAKTQ